ncbi:MAG: hypothetical protein H0W64_11255 [Gammaproteobacteria bacterium]|nr:hypothetical protein [Gammaproteobacteria bacterium]
MDNYQLASYLYEIADYLEAIQNKFRARAYRKAANIISNLTSQVTTLKSNNFDLQELPYIGKGINGVINKILSNEFNVIEFILHHNYASNVIQKSPLRLHNAKKLAELVIHILEKFDNIIKVHITGALRRHNELIDHLEFVLVTKNNFHWQDLVGSPLITNVIMNDDHAEVTILNVVNINLYGTHNKNVGETLLKSTGSTLHLKKLKQILPLQTFNFPDMTEKEIYNSIDLPYIEPELRMGRDEISLALSNTLPKLVQLKDIKGDLHCHTNETDGVLDLERVVEYAIYQGYEYLAITDHSQRLKITNGLDKKRLFNQIKLIDRLNSKFNNFRILKSSECDILEDGRLDFPSDVLKELDLVVCSVHSLFRLTKSQQTTRIIRAIENPYCTILGHPTGRLINNRLPYEVDVEKILSAARDHGCAVELNSQPYRLDLKAEYCNLAKSLGVKISLSSDAHSLRGFKFMALGLTQARRAGLEASDIINTYSLNNLKKFIRKTN